MFKFLLKDKVINTIVERITKEVNSSLNEIKANQGQNFDKVIEHLESLRIEVKGLEQRLTHKEMKDKMDYGQMQYKISSLQNELNHRNHRKKRPQNLDN